MGSYSGAAPAERGKAIVAVVAVHVALAFIIVNGLNGGRILHTTVEKLNVFDVAPPPPPPPPPPAPKASQTKKPEGAATKQAEPTKVVAPPSPRPSPIPAAKVAGAGNSPASGAAGTGNGTGADGSGSGAGGGGTDYSRFTPAQLIRNLTRGDYRSIVAGRLPNGRAMVSLRVEASGTPSGCRIMRSSGDPVVDGGLCPLIEGRLRFRPALDDHGRPIPYQLQYVATWSL